MLIFNPVGYFFELVDFIERELSHITFLVFLNYLGTVHKLIPMFLLSHTPPPPQYKLRALHLLAEST